MSNEMLQKNERVQEYKAKRMKEWMKKWRNESETEGIKEWTKERPKDYTRLKEKKDWMSVLRISLPVRPLPRKIKTEYFLHADSIFSVHIYTVHRVIIKAINPWGLFTWGGCNELSVSGRIAKIATINVFAQSALANSYRGRGRSISQKTLITEWLSWISFTVLFVFISYQKN